MYFSHFGLNQAPFSITPNPAFFFPGNKRGAILEALIYAVTHGEGIIKVTGEVGSGKTMLCRMLEGMLPKNVEVIYLVNPTLDREEVIYAIAGELDLATGGKRPDEVIRILQGDLIAKHVAGRQVVLLIEEAQAMPLDTLEEIRLFSNLETAHHKLLQIVLFGQPELDDHLNLSRMRQLKERITHSFNVPPLEPQAIPEYLMFRMRTAGYRGPDVFNKKAIKLISTVSEGIVRRISILADKALLAAFADNSHAIEPRHVKAAIQDSEFSTTLKAKHRHNLIKLSLLLGGTLVCVAAIGLYFYLPKQHLVTQPRVEEATSEPTQLATAQTDKPTSAEMAKKSPVTEGSPKALPSASALTKAQSAAASVSLQQRLERTKSWLANEKDAFYTVQITLVEAEHRSLVERALATYETSLGKGELHIYPTRIGNISRFGLIYGSYRTRQEAANVLAHLEEKWGYKPQIRTFGGIRQEIGQTKSADLWRR